MFHNRNRRKRPTVTKQPPAPVVGRTYYLLDPHDGVVSAVCKRVDTINSRASLASDSAAYLIRFDSLFDTYNACASANLIAPNPTPRRKATTPARKSPPRSVDNSRSQRRPLRPCSVCNDVATLIAGRFERGRLYWAFDETALKAAPVVVLGTNPQVDAGGCVAIKWRSTGDKQRIDPRHLFDDRDACEIVRAQRVATNAKAAEGNAKRGRGRPFADVQKTTRQLGRVSAEDWATMQEAAKLTGKTFTAFAVEAILRQCKRVMIYAGRPKD